tara:strand:- start:26 stop:349 length:324 start_codon:yes stop_codon:yes gene_type:complete
MAARRSIDAATERTLGEISGAVKSIEAAQIILTSDFKDYCAEDRRSHAEMGKLQQQLATEMAANHADQQAHVEEDNRRFRLLWRFFFSGGALITLLVLIARELGAGL